MPRKINDYATRENSLKVIDLLVCVATYGVSNLFFFAQSDYHNSQQYVCHNFCFEKTKDCDEVKSKIDILMLKPFLKVLSFLLNSRSKIEDFDGTSVSTLICVEHRWKSL